MRKQLIVGIALIFLLTTFISEKKIVFKTFNIQEIIIENNFILKDEDIKNDLTFVYNQNLFFLNNSIIENSLKKNSFIESFKIKKIYPNILKIKISEKKPIAILFKRKKKFYLSEKIELIEYNDLRIYQDLPYVFGNKEKFKTLYIDLKKINFPFELPKKYILYGSNRWDIETVDKKVIKLSNKNYLKNLKNYLNLRDKKDFKKYKIFDYRIESQLILK